MYHAIPQQNQTNEAIPSNWWAFPDQNCFSTQQGQSYADSRIGTETQSDMQQAQFGSQSQRYTGAHIGTRAQSSTQDQQSCATNNMNQAQSCQPSYFPDEVSVLRAENAEQKYAIECLKGSLRSKTRFMLWDSAYPQEVNEAVYRFYEHYVCRHFPNDRCHHDRSRCGRIHYLVTPRDLRYDFWLVRQTNGNLLASRTYTNLVYLAHKEKWQNFSYILRVMQRIKRLLTRF